MEGGFLDHTPAWRTYHYTGKKKEKVIAGEATAQQLIAVLEEGNLKYETYFKLIIATGMRRGECCGLQWGDINWDERSIHIQQNVVKVTGEDIIAKETKTVAGGRYVYFSLEMVSLLQEFQRECAWETETYDGRELEDTDYIFRRHGDRLPMTPSTFAWRFKLILKKHGLPPGEDGEHHVVLCVGIGALGLPYGGAPAQGMGNIVAHMLRVVGDDEKGIAPVEGLNGAVHQH